MGEDITVTCDTRELCLSLASDIKFIVLFIIVIITVRYI